MSRSYRTDKERQIATRRMRRDPEGNLILPRIVRRKPRPGDIHPILTRQLRMVFERVPVEYLYNLRSVELLPRKDAVGDPFGMYTSDEKRIILYSLPLEWELEYSCEADAQAAARSLHLKPFGATTHFAGNRIKVAWASANRMGYWFCCIVLFHEFGHHFRSTYQAKHKPGIRIRRGDEEFFADRKAFDTFREVFIRGRTSTLREKE